MTNLPQHGVVLVFTDAPSKHLGLEEGLIALRDEKELKIFIVLAPRYNGLVNDSSWNVYENLSEGRIYNMADFNRSTFIEEVVQVVGSNCGGIAEPTGPAAPAPASELAGRPIEKPMDELVQEPAQQPDPELFLQQDDGFLAQEPDLPEQNFNLPEPALPDQEPDLPEQDFDIPDQEPVFPGQDENILPGLDFPPGQE